MAELQERSTRPCSARPPWARNMGGTEGREHFALESGRSFRLLPPPRADSSNTMDIDCAGCQHTVSSRYQDVFREERQNSDESCLRSQHMRPPSFPHCNLQFVRNLTRNAIYSQRNVLSPFHPYDPWFYLMILFPILRAPRTTL